MIRKKIQNYLINGAFFLWIGAVGYGFFSLLPLALETKTSLTRADTTFGWKYPATKFPSTGMDQLASPDTKNPGGIFQGLPVRLIIPSINVDSTIEDAYITSDGRMDVLPGSTNVAWFPLGPYPGKTGNSVIGGHYGVSNGVSFVFQNLNKLKIGDKVYIENDKGETLAFKVKSTKYFGKDADSSTVFTSKDDKAHLNLITCEGVWNQVNGSYPDRLVVFTDAILLEGTAPIVPKLPETKDTASSVPKTIFSSPIFKDIVTPMDKVITSILIFLIASVMIEIFRPIIDLVFKYRVKNY